MRRGILLALLGVLAIGGTACRVPSPLTTPHLLTPPVDATAEIRQVLGEPPPAAQTAAEAARNLAIALTRQHEGCEVLTIAQVIWIAPSEPASAALEVRGLCDDAVAGLWYEVTIEGDDQLGWVVATASKQDICARGVSGTVCV